MSIQSSKSRKLVMIEIFIRFINTKICPRNIRMCYSMWKRVEEQKIIFVSTCNPAEDTYVKFEAWAFVRVASAQPSHPKTPAKTLYLIFVPSLGFPSEISS